MKQYGTGGFCTETATFMKRATHTWSDTINWCICSHDYDPFVSLRISIFVKLCICGFSHTSFDTLNLCIFSHDSDLSANASNCKLSGHFCTAIVASSQSTFEKATDYLTPS